MDHRKELTRLIDSINNPGKFSNNNEILEEAIEAITILTEMTTGINKDDYYHDHKSPIEKARKILSKLTKSELAKLEEFLAH